MKLSPVKKLCLSGLIIFLSLSALLTIIFLLVGKLDSTQIKVICSTLILSGASVLWLAAMAFIEKRKSFMFGYFGVFCIAVSALLLILGIWIEVGNELYWKITFTMSVLACAVTYIFLVSLPEISISFKWIHKIAITCVSLIVIMILLPVWFSLAPGTGYFRTLGVISTIQVLLTIIIPILSKIYHPDILKSIKPKNGKPKVGIGVIIENSEGKILIGKRCGSHAPYYSIPGGALETGETFESCAFREIKEETGLEIESPVVIALTNNLETYHREKVHYISVILHSDKYRGELALMEPEKCEGWIWCNPEELPVPHFDASSAAVRCFLHKKFYMNESSENL